MANPSSPEELDKPLADEDELRPALFKLFPATEHHRLIVRYPDEGDSRLSYQFADAAARLATTYSGRAHDDAMLLPWLYLYRHAIELSLKASIKTAAQLRRNNGEDSDNLEPAAVSKRLRQRDLGHKLKPLIDELNGHLCELQIDTVPASTMAIVELLNHADPGGMSFRYSGELPRSQDFMDFPAFNAALQEAYGVVAAAEDVLYHYADGQGDWLAYRAEIEADMRADFEAEMRWQSGYEGY